MVSPYAELIQNAPLLYQKGRTSLRLWPKLVAMLASPRPIWHPCGTILLSHQLDRSDFVHQAQRIARHLLDPNEITKLNPKMLEELEPSLNLSRIFNQSLYFDQEAFIHIPRFFESSSLYFSQCPSLSYQQKKCNANDIKQLQEQFDHVIDVRGLGAKETDPDLVAVRGEAMVLHAPKVNITHMIRIAHPQKALYIIPRSPGNYYLGATSIYGDDNSQISLKSLLDLGTSAYSLCAGFAEARLISTHSATRPSYRSALPKSTQSDNLWKINGLYRHGYLLAPTLADELAHHLTADQPIVNKEQAHESVIE